MTRPNGITTNYTYDSLSRLLSVLHQSGTSTIDGAVYTLDAAGNRSAKQDDLAGVTTTYGYDPIYELLSATQGGTTTESYTYDPVGNRTASLGVSSYTTNSSNEMTANSNASYTYDDNGNTTSKTDSIGTTSYTWDFENRLKQVTLPGTGGTVSFLYDPFGRRIQKAFTRSGTTTTTNYVYNGDNVVETTDQNGNVVAKYAQGQGIDEPLAESTAGATSFYEQDGLGSVTSLTSSAGALAQTYTYDSFGKTTNSSGSVANPFRYTGREFDLETGLYYYRTRYYDSSTGRFLSEDPMQFQAGQNFYRYVSNSPIDLSDPSGEVIKVEGDSADVQLALIYLEASSAARSIIDPLEQSSTVYVVDAGGLASRDQAFPYEPVNVVWNPHRGLCVKNGLQSASIQLLHELKHLLQYQQNQPFNSPAAEESAVKATNAAASQLGEPTRANYSDAGANPEMILPIPSGPTENCGCTAKK